MNRSKFFGLEGREGEISVLRCLYGYSTGILQRLYETLRRVSVERLYIDSGKRGKGGSPQAGPGRAVGVVILVKGQLLSDFQFTEKTSKNLAKNVKVNSIIKRSFSSYTIKVSATIV